MVSQVMKMEDFNVGVTLGTGSFGRVRFAIEKVSIPALSSSCLEDSRCQLLPPAEQESGLASPTALWQGRVGES